MTNTLITPPAARTARAPLLPIDTQRCYEPERRSVSIRTVTIPQARVAGIKEAARNRPVSGRLLKECLAHGVTLTAYLSPLIGMWIIVRPIL